MEIQLLNKELTGALHDKARANERLRMNFDLRTTALEVGTRVPIHRHLKTSETVVCLEGCLDWVFYEEMAGVDTGGPAHDGETAADETQFVETARLRVCPRDGVFGIQVPQGAWHSIEVHEASTIFEAKDGAYAAGK